MIAVGACLQGSIGFGMGLVAAPVLALLDPGFVPGPLLANALVLTTLLTLRERRSVDAGHVKWALSGSVLGSAVAAGVLTVVSARGFSILFGALVLFAVLLSALGLSVDTTRRNVCCAGLLGGFMGATSAIGGPPVALVFQRLPSAVLRGTLSAYFALSTVAALAALAVVGRFGAAEVGRAAALLPGLLIGFAASTYTAHLLDGRATRPVVLVLSGIAGAAVLVRSVL